MRCLGWLRGHLVGEKPTAEPWCIICGIRAMIALDERVVEGVVLRIMIII